MAVDLSKITNPKNTAIEVYKADFATPDNIEGLRFWLQGELNRIQAGFISTDEVLKLIASAILDDGGEGTEGPIGPQGPAGEDGRSIQVYQQQNEPADAIAGDIWFKTEYV